MTLRKLSLKILKWQHFLPISLFVLCVIFANSIYFFTGANPNPLLQKSGLAVSSKEGIVAGHNTIDPNDGFTSQALGNLSARDWLHGKVPYWNHQEGVGAPLAGEMQAASFSPLTLLLALPNGLFYIHLILEIIAGIATYFLLIKLKLGRKAAFFGGLAFALNGTFAWLANAAFNPIAFLPVLLLGIELSYEAAQGRRSRGWLLITLGIAGSLYGGFPETAYIDGLLCAAWTVTRFFQLDKTFRRQFTQKVLLGGLTGVLISLPILVAFYDYFKYANVGLHANNNTVGLSHIGLSSLFMPYIYGPIFGLHNYDATLQLMGWWSSVGGYITAAVIPLAVIGVVGKKDRPIRLVLAGWFLITVARTYGFLGLGHVLNIVPGLKSTAFYRYSTPSFELAIIILAAFGISDLIARRVSSKTRIVTASVTALVITAGVVRAIPTLQQLVAAPRSKWWAIFSIMLTVFTILFIFLAQFITKRSLRGTALVAIALVEVMILFMIPQLSTPRNVKLDTAPVTFLQQNLGTYRFTTLGPIDPNYGSYYDVAEININDLPIPKLWSNYIKDNLDSNAEPLIFTGSTLKDPNGMTPLQAVFKNLGSYEEVGTKYLVAPSPVIPGQVLAKNDIREVFSSKAATVYELPNPKPYFEITKGNCAITPKDKDNLSVNCKTPATLVRRELFMNGWSVKTGSNKTIPTEYKKLFQEVNLPPGQYEAQFNYTPPTITLAYVLSGMGLLMVAGEYVIHPIFIKPRIPQAKRLK